MSPAPLASSAQTIALPKNSFLFYQGTESDYFYILNKGRLDIIINEVKDFPLSDSVILAKGKRVAVIEPESTVGELGCLRKTARTASVCASEDCTLIQVPATRDEMISYLSGNPRVGISMLKILGKRLLDSEDRFSQINKFLVSLQSLFDMLAIINKLYFNQLKDALPAEKKKILLNYLQNSILRRGEALLSKLQEKGITLPETDESLLRYNLADVIDVTYGVRIDEKEYVPDIRLVTVINRMLELNVPAFEAYLVEDSRSLMFMILMLSDGFTLIDRKLFEISVQTEKYMAALGHASSGAIKIMLDIFGLGRDATPAIRQDKLAAIIEQTFNQLDEFNDEYLQFWGKPLVNQIIKTPQLHKELSALLAVPEPDEPAAESAPAAAATIAVGNEVPPVDPLRKLVELSIISGSEEEEISKRLAEYKGLSDRFDTDGEVRRLKKEIGAKYWAVVYKVFEYCKKINDIPLDFKYLFRYGLFDRSLVSDGVLAQLPPPKTEKTRKIPIFFLDEWIDYINSGKEVPSNTEMGQNYEEYVTEQKNNLRKGETLKLSQYYYADFEIDNLIKSAARMCSGSLSLDFPILDEVYLKSDNLKKNLVTKQLLEDNLLALLGLDYSAFFREVKYVSEGKSEYYYAEIHPNFIICPVIGTKAIAWQEIIGNKRNSRGRVIFPVILNEDFAETLLDTVAHFRWELAKTMAGYSWGDPIEGGFTGKYYDYLQFYKKNPDLTDEVKEQLRGLFAKYHSTQERFAYDYSLWIKFEREGIQKLNKVNREILYQYVPFPKPIRSRLAGLPQFERTARVDENRRVKQIQALENRKKRMANEGVDISKMIETSIRYFTT